MKSIDSRLTAFLAGIAFALFVPCAQAAPFTNGGFETGTFAGWTQTGDTSFSGVDSFSGQSGAFGAFFGPTDPGGISQTFDTTSGAYRVSFLLQLDDSSQPNRFSWAWNGVMQTPVLNNVAGFSFAAFSGLVLATGTSSTLSFSFVNPQSFWLLDNVTVAAVPEPETIVLLGAGLLLIARRAKRTARRA